MEGTLPKRRRVSYVKGELTASPELWAAGWRLDPHENSQVLVPPPGLEEDDVQGENDWQGEDERQGESTQAEEGPQCEEESKEPEGN